MIRKLSSIIVVGVLLSCNCRLIFLPYVAALISIWGGKLLPRKLWRRTLVYFPLVIAIAVERPHFSINIWEIVLNTLVGFFLLLLFIKELKVIFSKTVREFLPKVRPELFYSETIFIYSSAVIEEIFFKGFMLYKLSHFGMLPIVVVSFLFTFLHWINTDPARVKDHIAQFVMMFCTGLMFYFTNSVIGCILCHCIYGTPYAVKLYFQAKK